MHLLHNTYAHSLLAALADSSDVFSMAGLLSRRKQARDTESHCKTARKKV